jgi:two-component system sensor histidine kinase RstB
MTRLFIRFYLGVILILVGAWALQACAFRYFSPPENKRVFEDIFAGGVQLAQKVCTCFKNSFPIRLKSRP